MAGEAEVLGALLGANDAATRARVREMPIRAIMAPPMAWATPAMRASEAAALFDQAGVDTLPVVDAYSSYLGLVTRSDLVQDLVRPFRPPTVGGMATPLGVYLTTGAVSGGAGTLGLMLTGFVMFLVLLLAQGVGWAVRQQLLAAFDAPLQMLPMTVRAALGNLFPYAIQYALFLLLLRFSPIAGFHAAEHQVVHAIERAEPLLVDTVRQMPRVHPRCGTNLVAGVLILFMGGSVLSPFLGRWGDVGGFALSFVFAMAYWRNVGAWLQQHLTTRPATDAQIESAIRAANEVLQRHSHAPYAPIRPAARLWRMGFLQILGGFMLGIALLTLVYLSLPGPVRAALAPWLGELLLL
jgi:Protein of unknown function (DUF1385)/Domain of unknown function (DUF6391)/CBS domain